MRRVCLRLLPASVRLNEPLGPSRAHSRDVTATRKHQEAGSFPSSKLFFFFATRSLSHSPLSEPPVAANPNDMVNCLCHPQIHAITLPHTRAPTLSVRVCQCAQSFFFFFLPAERLAHVFLSQTQGQMSDAAPNSFKIKPNTFKIKLTVVAEEPMEVDTGAHFHFITSNFHEMVKLSR